MRLASGQKTVELVPTDTVGDLKEHACSLVGCTAVTILLGCVGLVWPPHIFGICSFLHCCAGERDIWAGRLTPATHFSNITNTSILLGEERS
jgi:hypothetical protein